MNIFLLGLRITSKAQTDEGVTNVLAESLPSTEKRVATAVQLKQKSDHYVGKILSSLEEGQTVMAVGPTKPNPDSVLIMQPMLVVTQQNFDDILAINLFMATGGLGPKTEEVELEDTTVTNRSIAWQNDDSETSWFKLSAFGELSKQLSDLGAGTPTIAVGKISSSEKNEKKFLNCTVDKILYLPRSQRKAPKKAADPEKGLVATAALGSSSFDLD